MRPKIIHTINYLFFLAILLILWNAIRSQNFDLSQLTNKFLFFILLIGLLIIFMTQKSTNEKKKVYKVFIFFKENARICQVIVFVSLILIQMLIILNYTGEFNWDVSLISRINKAPSSNINNYLSQNPNNALYFFILSFFSRIQNFIFLDSDSLWNYFQLINCLILDLSFLLLFQTATIIFNKKTAYIVFYLSLFSLGFSPWILVPYTDTIAFFLTSCVFFIYSLLQHNLEKNRYLFVLLLDIFLGLFVGFEFLLKPSSIVFLIALPIISLFVQNKRTDKNLTWKKGMLTILFVFSFFCIFLSFSYVKNHQNLVSFETEQNQAKPCLFFMMMGLHGTGGFNGEDTAKILSIPTREQKIAYAKKEIIHRLKDYGPMGYVKFLFNKYAYNTQNGDFGWSKDGKPIFNKPAKNKFQLFIHEVYSYQHARNKDLRFFMQCIWLVVLVGMLFSYKEVKNAKIGLILKLSILGGLFFLLLFEGGRSRYLIQYLPMFYLLAGLGYARHFSVSDEQQIF
ncbi:hypothetical protein QQG09_00275 [Melissococcus plutonius]|uniref:Integral membrane protein n=5 Tax=Melissococcus plutonius TaxID=33970 RepID=A0A2Z5Y3X3_9ENTE|nr:hypothetical protein [Melissococcus plutonius]MCV2498651.1 hypothetical protein [Melissococcus plutonius]MCV2501008.1 hypothetical protein [Melissococcus plutonius]MCV2504682.1 hypothetical protein [Melissococcus plutonius]MCV2507141.1 hypothetical protein [Melissococcus plutonius]MCV2519358.1 hypothetical protein [Melissococcus plutonius]